MRPFIGWRRGERARGPMAPRRGFAGTHEATTSTGLHAVSHEGRNRGHCRRRAAELADADLVKIDIEGAGGRSSPTGASRSCGLGSSCSSITPRAARSGSGSGSGTGAHGRGLRGAPRGAQACLRRRAPLGRSPLAAEGPEQTVALAEPKALDRVPGFGESVRHPHPAGRGVWNSSTGRAGVLCEAPVGEQRPLPPSISTFARSKSGRRSTRDRRHRLSSGSMRESVNPPWRTAPRRRRRRRRLDELGVESVRLQRPPHELGVRAVGLERDDPTAREAEGRVDGEVADIRSEVEDRRRSPEAGEKAATAGGGSYWRS